MAVTKYYPVQGTNKFQTVSFPMVKAFMVDFGAQAVGTANLPVTFPKGSTILGIVLRFTEAAASGGAATAEFKIGAATTGALALASMVSGAVVGSTTATTPVVLTADTAFTITVALAAMTAGKAEVFVIYSPIPNEALDTSNFAEFVTA